MRLILFIQPHLGSWGLAHFNETGPFPENLTHRATWRPPFLHSLSNSAGWGVRGATAPLPGAAERDARKAAQCGGLVLPGVSETRGCCKVAAAAAITAAVLGLATARALGGVAVELDRHARACRVELGAVDRAEHQPRRRARRVWLRVVVVASRVTDDVSPWVDRERVTCGAAARVAMAAAAVTTRSRRWTTLKTTHVVSWRRSGRNGIANDAPARQSRTDDERGTRTRRTVRAALLVVRPGLRRREHVALVLHLRPSKRNDGSHQAAIATAVGNRPWVFGGRARSVGLDRARAQQQMPVRAAGRHGEGRGRAEQVASLVTREPCENLASVRAMRRARGRSYVGKGL